MPLMTHFGFWIYYGTSEMLDWRTNWGPLSWTIRRGTPKKMSWLLSGFSPLCSKRISIRLICRPSHVDYSRRISWEASYSLVKGFCKVISGWIIRRWCHTLDSKFVTEPLEFLADELGHVIMNDSIGHTKIVEHVMLDELDHVQCLHFFQGTTSIHLEK